MIYQYQKLDVLNKFFLLVIFKRLKQSY